MTDGILDREKVMRGLEKCTGASSDCEGCPYADENGISCSSIMNIMRDAFALLKEQEPRVMTLDQIIETGGEEPIYLETPDMDGVIPAILQPDDFEDGYLGFGGTWRNSGYYHGMNYGRTWRCWTSRPSPEQRRDTKWEDGEADA